MYKRSDQQRNGRYVQGGKPDIKGGKIAWWERKVFPRSPSDITYVITTKYKYRPDMLAYDMYGKASLMWVILQYNSIVDIHEEFKEGSVITLPSRTRLFSELLVNSN